MRKMKTNSSWVLFLAGPIVIGQAVMALHRERVY